MFHSKSSAANSSESSDATARARAPCSSCSRASPNRTRAGRDLRPHRQSLLEVGTGFHLELTGRENIYLSGAILGMRRAEIAAQVRRDRGLRRSREVPRHSRQALLQRHARAPGLLPSPPISNPRSCWSTKCWRWATPLSRRKCLGKMGDVARAGRTIIFVSHNMNAIEQLCNRVILLESGNVKRDSREVRSVLTDYLFGTDEEPSSIWVNDGTRFRNSYFVPARFAVVDESGTPMRMPVRNDAEMWVEMEGEVEQSDPALTIGYAIYSEDGNLLYWSYQTDQPESPCALTPGFRRLRSKLPKHLLNEGNYRIELIGGLHFREWLFAPGMNAPHVNLTIQGGLSESPYWIAKRPGLLAPLLAWEQPDGRPAPICEEQKQLGQ